MSDKTGSKIETPQEITFKCKFCGETKPLSDMVVIRHYYPQLTACRDCSISSPSVESNESPEEEQKPEQA